MARTSDRQIVNGVTYMNMDSDARQQVDNARKTILYTDDQYGSYAWGPFEKPYDKRISGLFRIGNVYEYEERYEASTRAIMPIDSSLITSGKLIVHNPDKYPVGIYNRKKSDNQYIGYVQAVTNKPCFDLTGLDTDAYVYFAIAVHYSGGSQTNWTEAERDALNRRVFMYSGTANDRQKSLALKFGTNMITPDIIHIGKYYYGSPQPADNPDMAYTDLIPVRENRTYYFPYLTLGYSWYESDAETVIGGDYAAVEDVAARDVQIALTAPAGAAFIGVSVRSGDVTNMILSELQDSRAKTIEVSALPVAMSKTVREPLNWIYDTDFKYTRGGSRLVVSGQTFDGEKVTIGELGGIANIDQICMDKSKTDVIFSVPSGTPRFLIGINGSYAQTAMENERGALAVEFKADGVTAEIRTGTGAGGNYGTLIRSVDISALSIQNGRKFVLSIEKDTISRWVVSLYDAMTPDTVITETIEAEPNPLDENLYNGQIRGWGGPYAKAISGSIDIWKMQMYSMAPTYPKVAIWGDSYVENFGRNPDCSYANLIRDALGGNAFLSGQGGATSVQTSYRMAAEINACAPQYIILGVGVNDSFGGNVNAFKTAVQRMITMIEEKGAVPILVTVPNVPAGNSTTAGFCETVNPWIRSLGYDYIDIAYALSTGDGTTGDTDKFVADQTHPNLVGGQAIFNYIRAHLPYLLWK